jgi:tetratricopeptide (TPR) repeat protein
LAATHLSIGVLLADHQERYPEALPHFDESYRIDMSIGAQVSMGYDQINRAATLWQLGRYEEARAALDEAHSIASEPAAGFKTQLASVELNRAQMAFSLGNRAEAITRAMSALKLSTSDYEATALSARQTLARIQALSGAPKRAAALVEEIVSAARELKSPGLLSSALLASAEVRIAGGDGRGALADAQAAQKMFAAAAQLESEWHAWLVAARSALVEGDSSSAYDYAIRAESSRAALQARWGDDHYRGYIRRPDIQVRLKQLGQLLGLKTPVPRTRRD